jgi:hypothetical protein
MVVVKKSQFKAFSSCLLPTTTTTIDRRELLKKPQIGIFRPIAFSSSCYVEESSKSKVNIIAILSFVKAWKWASSSFSGMFWKRRASDERKWIEDTAG